MDRLTGGRVEITARLDGPDIRLCVKMVEPGVEVETSLPMDQVSALVCRLVDLMREQHAVVHAVVHDQLAAWVRTG